MSRRERIALGLILAGCLSFLIYGLGAGIFSARIAEYQYQALSKKDWSLLGEEVKLMSALLVRLVGFLGVGSAVCAGALFWIGFQSRSQRALIFGIVGGAIALIPLFTIHLHYHAWLLFIADNVCFFLINLGLTIGAREIFQIIRGKFPA